MTAGVVQYHQGKSSEDYPHGTFPMNVTPRAHTGVTSSVVVGGDHHITAST